jgi:hypothetical protein
VEACDRCGFRALFVVTLSNGQTLTLCGHHGAEHASALVAAGATVAEMDGEAVLVSQT